MTHRRKIGIGLAGFLLSLLVVCNYLSSPFINSEWIKKKIQAAASQKAGGQVDFHSIDLSIFPSIHARVDQVTISLPGKIKGSMETLDFFPKILPLFAGKVRIGEIDIGAPEIEFTLPRAQEKRNLTKEPVTFDMVKEIVVDVLSPLLAELPEILITIKDGTGNIVGGDKTLFDCKDVQSEISSLSQEININITATSGICEDILVKASLDRRDFKGDGVIQLDTFQPQPLIGRFLPDAPCRISEPIDKLSLHVKTDGLNELKMEVEGSPLSLKVKRGDGESFLKGKKVQASLYVGETETKLSLAELNLENPHLNIMGDVIVDHETRQISLELTGSDIDIDTVRKEALALAGDSKVIKRIFQILKGGRVPEMVFKSGGKTFDDLGNMENLVIKGTIRKGNIFIPGPDFALEDVAGDVVVEQGIVEGTNIGAKLEDGYGEEGRISIGLKGEDAPLHVETEIMAAAGQIPLILKRFVGNKIFLSEIDRVMNVQGTVAGKLLLDGPLNAIHAEVDIDKIDVSAHYQEHPFPLHIKDGGIHYDRENISLVNLGGTFGSSSFSGLSARASLGKDALLEIQSGKFVTYLKEIYPWLSSFDTVGPSLKEVKSLSGILKVSSLNLNGPLTRPKNWQTEVTGEVKDLLVDTTLFPEPVEVNEALFKGVGKEFSLIHSMVKTGDCSLQVSGAISHRMAELDKADIEFNGEIGKDFLQWIEKRVNVPVELSIRPPLSIQKAHITWEKNSGMSCVSNLTLQNGPEISLDVLMNPHGMKIKNVHIQDSESNAVFAFDLGRKAINVSFTGNLSHATTDKVFLNTPFAKEWIKGDFKAHIQLDQPKHSLFQGTLEGKNLSVPWNREIPFNIKDISLRADGKSVSVDSHILALRNNHLAVQGNANVSENSFLFDFDVSADRLNWDTMRTALPIDGKAQDKRVGSETEKKDIDQIADKGEKKRFWDVPVKGLLRLDAESFTFDQYTWKPLRTTISFEDDGIKVDVTDADLCGISCLGFLQANPQDISLDFQLLSRDQDLNSTFACFGDTTGLVTGRFNMKARAVSHGAAETLGKKLQGNFDVTAKDGRIYRYGLIASLFAFLNLTEILRGKLPDVVKQGFGYKSITANGEVQNGILNLEEVFIDGSSMGITSCGNVDLMGKKIDLKVLVSPFKTVDFVVRKIPLIGKLLGGNLVSIPVRITGDIENPSFSYLSPKAVGKKLLDITTGILKAPVKIIKPVILRRNRTLRIDGNGTEKDLKKE